VQGIGFLGAGLIFRSEEGAVQGLTTAAAVWGAAAIGTMVGAGRYALGLGMGALGSIRPRRSSSSPRWSRSPTGATEPIAGG